MTLSEPALGPKTIHFNVTFSPIDVGSQAITATINQAHSIVEATGVDVEKCALGLPGTDPNNRGICAVGQVEVPKDYEFKRICKAWGGHLALESQIHCEFKP